MNNIKTKLINLIKKISSFLYNKKLLVFIGKRGITIAAYNRDQILNSIFSNYDTEQEKETCHTFLRNYKNHEVLILLDTPKCQIKHEFMPMLHTIIKFNPVEKFIQDNYPPEDIVAYNIYNIDDSNGEVWETLIASAAYTDKTSEIIEFVIYNSFNFSGIYFLALEFEPIIDQILEEKNINNYQNDLQIFSTITEASGIKVAIKYKKNILHETSIEIPADKSDLYLSGMIRNFIEDKIIQYKSYIQSLDLRISLVFLCNEAFGKIFEEIPNFSQYKIITYITDSSVNKDNNSNFEDNKLLKLFMKNRQYIAMNKLIKSITNLATINSIIFKPLLITLICVIGILANFKYKEMLMQKETISLNNKYYSLSEKYRSIKKRHPEIENINNLTDFYNLQKILSHKSVTPFEFLQKIFSIDTPNITLSSINWYSEDNDFLDKKISLVIYLNYTSEKNDINAATKTLIECLNQFKSLFQNYTINYTINYDKIIELPKRITLPATLVINGNTEGV